MKKLTKKIVSMFLAFCMMQTLMVGASAASNDYTTWKQGDPMWGDEKPWPNCDGEKYDSISDAGCALTSVAILLRHYNIVTESDVNKFNPKICNDNLMAVGAMDSAGNLHYSDIALAYPGFDYVGTKAYALAELKNLYGAGYACMLERTPTSERSGHYVAVKSIDGDTVHIMDPGSSYNNTLYDGYKPTLIHYFKVTKPEKPVVQVTKVSNLKTLPCSQGTDKRSQTIRPTKKGEKFTVEEKVVNRVGNLWYRVVVNGQNAYVYAGDTQVVNDTITTNNVNYPTWLGQGATYSLYGTIKSARSNITEITVGVYTIGGAFVTGVTQYPNAKSYNVHNADSSVLFNILDSGQYVYKVIATNAAGKQLVVNRVFTVA